MPNDYDYEDDLETQPQNSKEEWEIKQWEKENNTGMSGGRCPYCGSKIMQSTYADSCMCGASDFAY